MTDSTRLENVETDLKAKVAETMEAMAADPVPATIKAYNSAKKALETFQTDQQGENSERFRNLEQAAAWIIAQGYIVSARTVRNHAATAGFPRQQKDGAYLLKEIASYAAGAWENPSKPSAFPEGENNDHKNRILKEQADQLELKNEITRKNYILRSDVEQRCAAAASFLKKDLGNFGPRVCDQLIDLVSDYLRQKGLDLEDINMQAVIPDLLDEYDRKLDSWLDRYAQSTKFGAETE